MEDFQPNQEFLNRILQLPCPGCGNQLSYSVQKQQIDCDHCGFVKSMDEANDLVKEQSLKDAVRSMATFQPASISKKVIDCSSCGAQLMIQDDVVATRCNFCGSEKVNEKALDKNLIQPQGIIPFKIPKHNAEEKFRAWIQSGWFHPNKLKRLAELGDIHGIYVPFWTYDAKSWTQWSGEAGYYYYETETYTDSNGETQTREIKKTRWKRKRGDFAKFFDDVLIVASKTLPHKVISPIYPFDLNQVINYTNDLMIGWESEIYNLNLLEGYHVAEKKMDKELREMASDALGGDTQRHLSIDVEKWGQTFKHIVLPVWLCSYIYNDKTYRFAVNGQTGKISGTKPTSWVKIASLILSIIAIIAIIVFAVMNKA